MCKLVFSLLTTGNCDSMVLCSFQRKQKNLVLLAVAILICLLFQNKFSSSIVIKEEPIDLDDDIEDPIRSVFVSEGPVPHDGCCKIEPTSVSSVVSSKNPLPDKCVS